MYVAITPTASPSDPWRTMCSGAAPGADTEGWSDVEISPNFALSDTTRDRPGLNALARTGDFGVFHAEALDRTSRDQQDVAAV